VIIAQTYLNFFFSNFIFCSKYDLYSKSKTRIDVEKVKPYYLSLIEKVTTLETSMSCFCYSWKSFHLGYTKVS